MPKSSARLLSTDREIQTAKIDSQRAEFRIKGARNLVLRVTSGGTKTWTFLYRSPVSGKRAKLSIGEYPSRSLASARTEALVLTLAVEQGKDPLVERRADLGADTFAALAKLFMAEHLLRNARGGEESIHTQELQRILDADILPAIGDYKAFAVKRFHVSTLVEAVANRGALVAADRALGLVRAVYRWANATGRLEVDPTLGLAKRNAGRPRRRVLSNDEIRRLWTHLDTHSKLSDALRDAYKLELLLGLRIGEIVGTKQNEIDLGAATWTIPAVRTKSNREHVQPIPERALAIIEAALGRAGKSPWLFPSSKTGGAIRPQSAVRSMERLRVQIGLTDVGTHDFRRTLASGLGDLGTPDTIIELILGHAPRTVAGKHYNWSRRFGEMRQALTAWDRHIDSVLSGNNPGSNVTPIRARG